ncbi:type II 3-dehydroquinate dehydratase [Cytobacillus oceanisediminis]|uniref:3-dehydroquinate dehydratase n=1 Tax=Cytobacillus oceanisediminis TaxID=665099 RepID=A0A562K0K2_9BACI|nr:type II 3-dehydroquinate dehydratase [Cytobacillus oceanisediminis]TWH88932.1 3-dehydroquinate dehydratase [Cytobacillus oceanisediminis]
MRKILLLNGPNLNLLGKREPGVYGNETLKHLEENITSLGDAHQIEVSCFQSNHEGELLDRLHLANEDGTKGIIFNPGAFTHYSYAIRDAIAGIQVPVIEVHISNVHSREEFRHTSVIAPVAHGQIVGLGFKGYELAFYALMDLAKGRG